MARSDLDRLFASFQRDSDPAKLAQVFDQTAPELLRVARFLARDAHGAEDLVQGTFLKAIEHRDRYDASQPVLPWLLGILANAARHERRQRARTAPAPEQRQPDGPVELAAQVELQTRLQQALHSLPRPYREVLVQRLEHGLDTDTIAAATGRKPSTVRTQVARGMDMLRRALPAGIGAAVAVVATPGRGLAAVRASVLQSMGVEGAVPVVAAGAGAVAGVLTMKKGLLLAALAALLLTSLLLFDRTPVSPTTAANASAATSAQSPDDVAAVPAPVQKEEPRRQADEVPAAMAGLQVVVRHAGGGAGAGIGLYLSGDGLGPLGREATTDAGGRALFADLPVGVVSIKPDRAPPQTTTLAGGNNTLELILPIGIDVEGRVVDPARAPVPGARVFSQSREHHDHAQYLTTADEAGRFSLRGIAPGTYLLARASGRQPSDTKTSAVMATQGTRKEMELRMGAAGFALAGRVVDETGQPVPHAMVAVAVDEDCKKHVDGLRSRPVPRNDGTRPLEREAFLLRADGDGRFQTDEAPAGTALLTAREPAPGARLAAMLVEVRPDATNECLLCVRAGAEVSGTVRDETGQPYGALPLAAEWRGSLELGAFEGGLGHLLSSVTAVTAADGSYRLRGLLAGEHVMRLGTRIGDELRLLEVPLLTERVTLAGTEVQRRDFTVGRRFDLSVRVLGPDGAPLQGWAVWADEREKAMLRFNELQRQRTDAGGRLTLRRLARNVSFCISLYAPCESDARGNVVDRFPARRFTGVMARDEEVVMQLQPEDLPTGALTGRLARGAPAKGAQMELALAGWTEVRRVALGPDGAFTFGNLPAGRYTLRSMGPGDPRLGPYILTAGQRLDLGDLEPPEPGTLTVTMTCTDGAPITAGRVTLVGPPEDNGSWDLQRKDAVFTSQPRAPGRYRLYGYGKDLAPCVRDVEILSGQDHAVELRGERGFRQAFTVTLPPGAVAPSPNARGGVCEFAVLPAAEPFSLHRGWAESLEFTLPMTAGAWDLRIDVPGFARVTCQVRLPAGGTSEPVVLQVR